MNQQQIKELTRNPNALLRFHMYGELPRCTNTPATPLRDLIEIIPKRLWREFAGITLSPELGFKSKATFHSLTQLYQWLGGNKTLIGNQTLPYMTWRATQFRRQLTLEDLLAHCTKSPSQQVLSLYNLNKGARHNEHN
ncbi:hypothetical protein [Shewanella aestuarii]|uniref:Uncharacterized protein n=1 Tax=Shewanella aestuarii TaxID=1028752 RepID=A0A6G9QRG2_9GAMM|nr:hypothetical protein [Shewanella aestuarii]QIR16635.1 hypothetical protein HBH39_19355 [Shewanella aestuarii]